MEEPHTDTSRWDGVREIAVMAAPILLGAMSYTVMQFVDQLMVSWVGIEAFAAVGSAGIWSFTLAVFFAGIAGCVSTFVSQSLGRGDKEHCSSYAWQGIYVSILCGSFAILMWPFSDTLFGMMGHTEEVTRLEVEYFNVRLFSYVFIAWHVSLVAFFQAIRKPIIPMYVAIVGNVVNVALNYVLIFGKFGFPKWGVAGAAAATVFALILQVVVLQAIFLNATYNREYGTRTSFAFDWTKTRDLFRIGWPSGTAGFLDVACWSLFTSFLVGRFGTTQLAAHNAAIAFMQLTFTPAMGLNQALAPIVGQWIGRGNFDIAIARTYTAMKIAFVYMTACSLTVAFYGDTLVSIFSKDPEVIRLGHILLIMAAIFSSFDSITIATIGALRGAGDTRFIMIALVVGSYCVFLPLSYLFSTPLGMGAIGSWIGATIYIVLLSGVIYHRFRSGRWRDIKIFSEDMDGPEAPPVASEAEPSDLGSS